MKYKLISNKLKGFLLVSYKEGVLNSISIEFKQSLTLKQWFHITNVITPELKDLNQANIIKIGLTAVELPEDDSPIPGNERVAIFCEYFKKAHGIAYKVSRAEGAKMRDLPIGANEFANCIKIYFECVEWWSKPKSITNFCGKINEIRQLISSPVLKTEKSKFPIPYDKEYAKNLSVGDLMKYHKVLRESGYKFDKHAGRDGQWLKV